MNYNYNISKTNIQIYILFYVVLNFFLQQNVYDIYHNEMVFLRYVFEYDHVNKLVVKIFYHNVDMIQYLLHEQQNVLLNHYIFYTIFYIIYIDIDLIILYTKTNIYKYRIWYLVNVEVQRIFQKIQKYLMFYLRIFN